ncbi:zinc-dependent metalloprotease [Chitinophaga nivalis]|uniref:Zinc-dependent metalloprotease n=1 Tax=Chitinophaga nivalis TaxID=2991709 RepID=A0ABT3IL35_9BACT|nr:zinc-dependent metalloprotease [Chitinophaga nivalis]MCW3465683.1 zinc-dependent metalloprotease [Chitinophaga nivalis]MCW3484626.1 zinc-dependent metalloprotease [Chitinophaga nivalis]
MKFQLKHLFPCLCCCSLLLLSCKKENTPAATSHSTDLLQQIKAAGFSTNGIIKTAEGYIVEGDILLTEKDLQTKPVSPNLLIAKTEQYRTNNLIAISGSREITISVSGLPAAYITAADAAIARYNALQLRLTFRRVASGSNVDIQNASLPAGVLGVSAGFPDAQGNPPSPIKLNAGYIGSSPSIGFLTTLIAHEIGHTIGFRHTDYFNRNYSCGFSNPSNEGDAGVGAINIPGTPTAEDPNSWMLACTSTQTDRPFNANDQIALKSLYGPLPIVGIGGYDVLSDADLSFAFDYNSTGKEDHLVLYRAGSGVLFVVKNTNGNFTPAFQTFQGLAGYNLLSPLDRVIPFDYNSSGKKDHLVIYRPGSGVLFILKNTNGNFTQVFQTFQGLGDYNLLSQNDKVFAFDYNSTGKADHLAIYRPGSQVLFILKNTNGNFTQVFQTFQGLGGYDLLSSKDLAFPFDYNSNGKEDHLVIYRPGEGVLYVLRNTNGNFSPVFQTHQGLGGYNLLSDKDRIETFDFTGNGKKDHLAIYRPGDGIIYFISNTNGSFSNVWSSHQGIGGYNLASPKDKVFAFDYTSSGKSDHLALYRPGDGVFYILSNSNGAFNRIY